MTTTLDVPPEVGAYLAAVRAALADLPAPERDDLLAEVEASIVESASESSGPIAARLGPPEEFAAELRVAAGLHESTTSAPVEPRFSRVVAEVREWAARDPHALRLRRLLADLAPIWWAIRGYLAVGLIALAIDERWSTKARMVPRFGTGQWGVLAIVVGVALSVWLGFFLRSRATPLKWLIVVPNVVLLLTASAIAHKVTDTSEQDALVAAASAPAPEPPLGLTYNGVPVDNIYPFSRDGRLLHDVLLFNGSGAPLDIASLDQNRRQLVTVGNQTIFNGFPIRYYDPGTRRVSHPDAAPRVEIPGLVTPAVEPATPTSPRGRAGKQSARAMR